MQVSSSGKPRLDAIDVTRGVALVAMAVYHFSWDLEFFGYVERGTAQSFPLREFARAIASSFLFLAGLGLLMAQGLTFKPGQFLKRLLKIAGAAALITVASYHFAPSSFIFFGILHAIAAFSVIGLLLRRINGWLLLALSVLAIVLPQIFRSEMFDTPVLWWIGLAPTPPVSNDFVPLFPWIGPFIAGMAVARLRNPASFDTVINFRADSRIRGVLAVAGRHSLLFYLLHQPVLIAAIWLFSQVFPAEGMSMESRFLEACQLECSADNEAEFCTRYCVCMLVSLEESGHLKDVFESRPTDALREQVSRHATECSFSMENEKQ